MSREDTNTVPPGVDEFATQINHLPESDSLQYDVDTSYYSITEAVVFSVAAATERDPLDLPPLYAAIDPDALGNLVGSAPDQESPRGIRVSFEYADCRVTVEDQETIRVTPSTRVTAEVE